MLSTITQSDLDRSVPLDVRTLTPGDTVALPQGGTIRGRYFNPLSAFHVAEVNGDTFTVTDYPNIRVGRDELPAHVVTIHTGPQETTQAQPGEVLGMVPDVVLYDEVLAAVATIEREVPASHRYLVEKLRDLLPHPARSFSISVQVGVTDADEATAVSRVREALEVANIDVLDLAVENQ